MKFRILIKFSMIKRKVLCSFDWIKNLKKCDIVDMMYWLLLIIALDNAVVVSKVTIKLPHFFPRHFKIPNSNTCAQIMPITLKTYSFQCCTYFEGVYEGIPHPPKERRGTKNNHLKYCWSENTRQEFFKQYSSGYGRKFWRNYGFGKKKKLQRTADLYNVIHPGFISKEWGVDRKDFETNP